MSESISGIQEGITPPGQREVPHSELVSSLFRDLLTRSKPDLQVSPSSPSASAGVVNASDGDLTPFHTTSFLDFTATRPPEIDKSEVFEKGDLSPKGHLLNDSHVLDLYAPHATSTYCDPLTPPPIHTDSPPSLSPTTTALEQSDPITAEHTELPFGEPQVPEFHFKQIDSVGTFSDIDVILGSPADAPSLETANTPEYYFITREPKLFATPSTVSQPPISTIDVESARNDFPALHQQSNGHPLIFLDNAATTQKPQAVIDATSEFYSKDNTNIHRAAYELAERATAAFENAREKVQQFLGAKDKKEIVFTRGTTEAINLVANTFGRKFIGRGDEILLTTLEHHANIVPWQLLAKQVGAVIKVVPINDRGELILEEYVRLLNHRTKLVSVAHVSNALGTVNPIEQIIQLAHARGVHVLVDGAQSTPHIPINVHALDADFFVFSGHKVFGPTGVGALHGKSHLLEILPTWQGGGHMIKDVTFERTIFQHAPEKFEAGTPDIAGAVGLGAAIDYLFKIGIPRIAAYEHSLLEYATDLLKEVPGLRFIGTATQKASVLSFIIPGIPNDEIASYLDKRGIAVRAGHHCALPAQRHFGLESTVRPSLAFYNNRSDVETLAKSLHSLTRYRV